MTDDEGEVEIELMGEHMQRWYSGGKEALKAAVLNNFPAFREEMMEKGTGKPKEKQKATEGRGGTSRAGTSGGGTGGTKPMDAEARSGERTVATAGKQGECQ